MPQNISRRLLPARYRHFQGEINFVRFNQVRRPGQLLDFGGCVCGLCSPKPPLTLCRGGLCAPQSQHPPRWGRFSSHRRGIPSPASPIALCPQGSEPGPFPKPSKPCPRRRHYPREWGTPHPAQLGAAVPEIQMPPKPPPLPWPPPPHAPMPSEARLKEPTNPPPPRRRGTSPTPPKHPPPAVKFEVLIGSPRVASCVPRGSWSGQLQARVKFNKGSASEVRA